MKLVHVNAVAEAGFPNIVSPVVFIAGCNLRCPYCLNCKLVLREKECLDLGIDQVVEKIKGLGENKILLSGGEPCMHKDLPKIIQKLLWNGITPLLSTNGTYPEMLGKILKESLVSFVAIDLKTRLSPPDRNRLKMLGMSLKDVKNVKESMELLRKAKMKKPSFSFEVRTTLYPPAVPLSEIAAIAKEVPEEASYFVLQQFRPRQDLMTQEASKIQAYDANDLQTAFTEAKKGFQRVAVRYP